MPSALPPRRPRPSALGRARARWQSWWMDRLPARPQAVLTHRNVYILPTRAGLMLALTLVLLLVGSINYQLNLGYLLTFLLAGCAFVGLHLTHNNLRGLAVQVQGLEPVFAGQALPVRVRLHNPTRRARHAVALQWFGASSGDGEPVLTDVAPLSDETVTLACPTPRRGRLPLPALRLDTRFPLGTVAAWHWWRPQAEGLVYPAPEADPPPLPRHGGSEPTDTAPPGAQGLGDEMEGLRPYRRGDPLKWVAWKKAARTGADPQQGWVSREFARPASRELWLEASHCGLSDTEGQLSRLCAWVLAADRDQLRYGLRLPGVELAPANGPDHRRRCLEALACA